MAWHVAPKRSWMRRQRARTHLLWGWDWTASVALEDLVEVWRDGVVVDWSMMYCPLTLPGMKMNGFGEGQCWVKGLFFFFFFF